MTILYSVYIYMYIYIAAQQFPFFFSYLICIVLFHYRFLCAVGGIQVRGPSDRAHYIYLLGEIYLYFYIFVLFNPLEGKKVSVV